MSDCKYDNIILTKQVSEEGTEFMIIHKGEIVGKYSNKFDDLKGLLLKIINFLE